MFWNLTGGQTRSWTSLEAGEQSFDFGTGAIEDAVAVMDPGFDESMN